MFTFKRPVRKMLKYLHKKDEERSALHGLLSFCEYFPYAAGRLQQRAFSIIIHCHTPHLTYTKILHIYEYE
jgi:hypothetical protein